MLLSRALTVARNALEMSGSAQRSAYDRHNTRMGRTVWASGDSNVQTSSDDVIAELRI